MAKINLEDIQVQLSLIGWKCLDKKYTNLDTVMSFQCNEGHKVLLTWRQARTLPRCPVCETNEFKKIRNIAAIPKEGNCIRILALDQSTRKTGWAVYDNEVLMAYGVYEAISPNALERTVDMADWLLSMIQNWRPSAVGFEETQYNPQQGMGHNTFQLLSELLGALKLTAKQAKKEVLTVNNKVWRKHCAVRGQTRVDMKRSAQSLVKKWYDKTVSDDESDAICIGKYFAETYKEKQS